MDQTLQSLRSFFKLESAGGITLVIASAIAMIFANTDLHEFYEYFLEIPLNITVDGFGFDKPMHYFINDGLMAVFFLLVGLEIKREVMEGELATVQQALLPGIAALGGIAVPALIYVYLNQGNGTLHGWAIPSATDIAFALGILALFGKRVPLSLKVFLTAVAVIDDLAAIIIIALFYTNELTTEALLVAVACLVLLFLMNKRGVGNITFYMVVGFIMWFAVLKSGVHATLAGVALGLLIPHKQTYQQRSYSMLSYMEHSLHPWVAFFVLPIFAFANAGIDFSTMSLESLTDAVPLGVAVGLFAGKQLGIFLFSVAAMALGIARMPTGVTYKQFYGVCILCGIGFTMSLFIGGLAFSSVELEMEARAGIIIGSLFSAVIGLIWLHFTLPSAAEQVGNPATQQ
ncbi:MAG: Na+/H+ antiporter NhaA [Rickettsiales bacterium]|nr:Na+/H+ antiporter NhaA [Rickettsiales bacterium]